MAPTSEEMVWRSRSASVSIATSSHDLNAEAGIDRLDLVTQQPRRRLGSGTGWAMPTRMNCMVLSTR
jgi:hypothetical protein